ncbi:MAG: hypothetical protein ABSG78_03890 [Verrucomicrobiota bacterium]
MKSLERQVKRNIDPVALQQWATNLLARHAGEYSSQDFYGTNMPPGLKKVQGFGHDVQIFPGAENEAHLWLFAYRKGGPVLWVGSPAFATPTNANIIPWKPGMYFVWDHFWY